MTTRERQETMQITIQGFNIRPILQREPELEQVLGVYRQCEDFLALGPVSQASLEMVRADLELSTQIGGIFCVIEDQESGKIVGVIDFVVSGYEADPGLAYLSLLMIAASRRGQGLGTRVVEAVEAAICSAAPVRAICAGVQANNPGGIRFWQQRGYQIVSEALPMGDGTVAYQLRKDLDRGQGALST